MKKLALIITGVLLLAGCGSTTIIKQASPVPAVTVTAQPSPTSSDSSTYQNGVTVDSQVSKAASMFRGAEGHETLALGDHLNGWSYAYQQRKAINSWNAAYDYYNSVTTNDNNANQQRYLTTYSQLVRNAITARTWSATTTILVKADKAWSDYQQYVTSINQT